MATWTGETPANTYTGIIKEVSGGLKKADETTMTNLTASKLLATNATPNTIESVVNVGVDSSGLHVIDDKKIFFGTNDDASIEYDEDGTDKLIIAGAVNFTGAVTMASTLNVTGNVAAGTSTADRRLHSEVDDATTNATTQALRLTHTTSGTPATNIGVGMEFEVETSASNNEILATIEAIAISATATAENGGIVFKTMKSGAAATEDFRIAGGYTRGQQNIADNAFGPTSMGFNGTSSVVTVADNDNLSFTNGTIDMPMSIVAFANMRDATNFWAFAKGVPYTTSEYYFGVNSDDKLIFRQFDASASAYIGRYYNTALTSYEGKNIVVAGTYSGSATNAGSKLYLGGKQVDDTDSNTGSYVAMENLTATPYIGRYSTNYANGNISKVLLFNIELTQAEVDALSSGAPVPAKYTGANNTALSTSSMANSDYDTFDGASATAFHAVYTTSGTQNAGTADEVVFTEGRSYIAAFTATLTSGAAPTVDIKSALGGTSWSAAGAQTVTAGQNAKTFLCATAGTGVVDFQNTAAAEYTIANFKITRAGCVGQWEPDGITDEYWFDKSGNELLGTNTSTTVNNQSKLIEAQSEVGDVFEAHINSLTGVYGVWWNDVTDTYGRIGTTKSVATATALSTVQGPVHAKMKRCIVNDSGVIQYYLDPSNSYYRQDLNTAATGVTGTADSDVLNALHDTGVFTLGELAYKWKFAKNTTDGLYSTITAKASNDQLTLAADAFPDGDENFEITIKIEGTDDAGVASKLSDTGMFIDAESYYKGRYVHNTTDDTYALITAKDDDNTLSISADIMDNGETYEIMSAVLDGTDGMVMVEIPKFWVKYNKIDNKHYWVVADHEADGFQPHPAFYKNGAWVPRRFVGAYPAARYDDGTSAWVTGSGTDDADGTADLIGSISGYKPDTDETRDEYRDMAANRGTGWRQLDFWLHQVVQFLYITEYASFKSQTMISAGNTQFSSFVYATCISNTGKSNINGNGSGGQSTVSGNSGDYMTYRGIEDLFGNTWQFVDGFNVHNTNTLGSRAFVCNTDTDFADDTDTGYDYMGNLALVDGYIKGIMDNLAILPDVAAGGSSSTYLCDYYTTYYNDSNDSGWRVVRVGGDANTDVKAGVFYVSSSSASSSADSIIGARLCF